MDAHLDEEYAWNTEDTRIMAISLSAYARSLHDLSGAALCLLAAEQLTCLAEKLDQITFEQGLKND
jgi:hypothetical protein